MNTSSLSQPIARPSLAQTIVALVGVAHLLTGLALLLAPAWFFANIGTCPPFNRHYEGDMGAFQIPLGLGLLLAARDPVRYRLLIGVAAAGNLLHTLNHIYDAAIGRAPLGYWVVDTGPLALVSVALLLATSRYLTGEARQ